MQHGVPMRDLIADWKENAKGRDDANFEFLRSLKQKSEKKVDRIALELHQEAFSIVDCTKCANCCRTLHPIFTETDIAGIAGHLGMATEPPASNVPASSSPSKRYASADRKAVGRTNRSTPSARRAVVRAT